MYDEQIFYQNNNVEFVCWNLESLGHKQIN